MAIKPKSRAHEDRIKALEQSEKEKINDFHFLHVETAQIYGRLLAVEKRLNRPWYKRILGL